MRWSAALLKNKLEKEKIVDVHSMTDNSYIY